MAYSQEEIKIITDLKAKGKSPQQIAGHIGSLRLGRTSSIDVENQNNNSMENKSTLFDNLGKDIVSTYKGVGEKLYGAGEKIVETVLDEEKTIPEKAVQIGAEAFRGGSRAFGEAIIGIGKSLLSPDQEKAVVDYTQNQAERIARTQIAQDIMTKYNSLPDDTKQQINNALGYAEGLLDIGTGGLASRFSKPVLNAVKTAVDKALVTGIKATEEIVSEVTPQVTKLISKTTGKIVPESPEIMNRVARLKPTDANKFEQLAGKTHGQYLTETGNFGTPDEIIKKETNKFINSVKDVDETLDSLPGTYQDGSIKDALTGLLDRAKSTSGENVKAPYLNRVEELVNKFETTGLTMKEINEAKRLYEKNVKLGYNKLLNATEVEKATNIDNALREWQINQADTLGFENIKELNKQTQLSKFLIDKLGDQLITQGQLNGVNLTDWIVLAGGDPTAVSAFLTKKFFSSKGVQSKIAELLNSADIKAPIKPKIGESKVPRLEAPKEGASKNVITNPINQPSRKVIDRGTEIVPNPVKNIDNQLIQEAKKYKSAEEFVKKQPIVYHGSSSGPLEKFDNKQGGAFFTEEYADATGYAGNPDNVYEGYLNFKNPLVIDAKGAKWDNLNTRFGKTTTEIISKAEKAGYDGVTFKNIVDNVMDTEGMGESTVHYAMKPENDFIDESQLIDIWNKANKK